MKSLIFKSIAACLALLSPFLTSGLTIAENVPAPELIISQIKITPHDGQFITLYNSTDEAINLGDYQVHYFNNYDAGSSTSNRLIALTGTLPAHRYFMLNDSDLTLCYQLVMNSRSLGFSSTRGRIEVIKNSAPNMPAILQDDVGWSKSETEEAQVLPDDVAAFLTRQPLDTENNPDIKAPGDGGWQTVKPDPSDACLLMTTNTETPTQVQTGPNLLLPSQEPPALIEDDGQSPNQSASTSKVPALPAADIGLMGPKITELLPNPKGTGNDSADEYIELYNPNIANFDLSGFKLQTGTKTLHSYSFPLGTILPPLSFTSFYSRTTGLSLSNTGSQAKLVDPTGDSVSASDIYANAKDGEAWALANGKWYWTDSPTPGNTNVIKQPAVKKASKAAVKSSSSTSKKPKSAATSKGSKKAGSGESPLNTASTTDKTSTVPLHPWTLAAVAGAAVLYGAYEYRKDIANRFFQFGKYFRARGTSRP